MEFRFGGNMSSMYLSWRSMQYFSNWWKSWLRNLTGFSRLPQPFFLFCLFIMIRHTPGGAIALEFESRFIRKSSIWLYLFENVNDDTVFTAAQGSKLEYNSDDFKSKDKNDVNKPFNQSKTCLPSLPCLHCVKPANNAQVSCGFLE